MIKRYVKGATAERELAKFLKEQSFSVVRSAGSGGSISTPDLVAIKGGRVLAFEIKSWSTKPRLKEKEFKMFREWCEMAGAIGFFAWKKGKDDWVFLNIKNYKDGDIKKDGISLNDLMFMVNV